MEEIKKNAEGLLEIRKSASLLNPTPRIIALSKRDSKKHLYT